MTSAVAVVLAAVVGIAIGAGPVYFWLANKDPEIGRIYFVHDIVDYDDNYDGNAKAEIVVYLEGEKGHVKGVTCLFPPDTRIMESPPRVSEEEVAEKRKEDPSANVFSLYGYASWYGVSKFRVVGTAEHLAPST